MLLHKITPIKIGVYQTIKESYSYFKLQIHKLLFIKQWNE